jgi:hypothetical protein
VKSIIDGAFDDVMPQRIFTVTAPEQVPAALTKARDFLKKRRESSQVVFLILDLFLLPSELKDLEQETVNDPRSPLTWMPSTEQVQELLCPYGLVQEETPEQRSGRRCLWSLRILHSLWRLLDPSIIVIFNAGAIRITDHDLSRVGARLVDEGVAWLYTNQDEGAGQGFINYLRVLRERAERTLPQPDVGVRV